MIITCGHLEYEVGSAQKKELEYLARWHADLQYIREFYGKDDPECEVSRKSVEFSIRQLDKLGVPFWLQNAALYFSENWRRYKSESLWGWLNRRGGYAVTEV